MKIIFFIREIDVRGGTHKQLLKLLDYTAECGIDFTVVTFCVDYEKTYSGFRKYSNQIKLFPAKRPWFFKIKGIRKYYLQYQKIALRWMSRDADVINIHDHGFEDFIPIFSNKKIIWQINDLPYYPGDLKRTVDENVILECKKKFERNLNYITDITVNVSKNAERLKKYYGRDSHVFYCGIEPIGIIRDNLTFTRFSQKKIHLLSSGVFFEYRNYETQLDVVELLIKKGYDTELRIIGDTKYSPDYVNKIKSIISEKGLQSKIHIEGSVAEEKFKKLHQCADFFLFINIDQSWGLAVFEAMSCGLPVIVSKSVGAIEVLQDRINAIFVEPTNAIEIADEIEKLILDQNYYEFISSHALDFPKTMTWEDSYCSKMIDLMSKI